MYRTYRPLAIFLMFVFHFSYALENQPDIEFNPCDLMLHGRDIYGKIHITQYPHISDFPLIRKRLTVEFHLNNSIPEEYRPAAHEAALEWNRKAGLMLIAISDEIDHSQWTPQQIPQISLPKNVIYWLDKDQYEDLAEKHEITRPSAGRIEFQSTSVDISMPYTPYVFLYDTDILMHAERNTVMGTVRGLLTRHLNRMGVEYPEDMDTVELQHLFIERLSKMNSDDFYNMVIQLMEDKEVTLPNGEPEDIQKWIITAINAEMDDIQPLTSFEDFRDLIIREYTLDLTSISNSTVLFKNHLLHEFGHTLGLAHTEEPDSLMRGAHITPVPRFPRTLTIPQFVDDLALHGLSCSYNLEDLRPILPL